MGRRLDTVAVRITNGVGTMWCALVFAGIAITATPGLFDPPVTAIAQWTAQAFLQLVLLSVIMVGQRLTSTTTEALIQETHDTVLQELTELRALAATIHAEVKN